MTIDEALTQGHFESAIAILDAEVRSAPDPNKLFLLVELKGYLEDFDGASADLISLDRLLPGRGYLEEFGPIIANGRVWSHRQTVADFSSQRTSMGMDLPASSSSYAEAMRLHARGETRKARHQLEQARKQATRTPGELTLVGGQTKTFSELWDADVLTGPHFVCSHPQALLDIPFVHVAELEFRPVSSFADSIWKPARVKTWTGNQALLRVYAYYVGTGKHKMELIRQCRMTLFGDENGYRLAHGQRDWQLDALQHEQGMSLVGINNVKRITFRREAA